MEEVWGVEVSLSLIGLLSPSMNQDRKLAGKGEAGYLISTGQRGWTIAPIAPKKK